MRRFLTQRIIQESNEERGYNISIEDDGKIVLENNEKMLEQTIDCKQL